MLTDSSAQASPEKEGFQTPPLGQWGLAWKHLRRHPLAMIGLYGFLGLILISLAAPWLTSVDPTEMDFNSILSEPSVQHPFGTDNLGRDIFSRVVWGGRESLRVGLVAVFIAVCAGVVLGLISGYFGGMIDMIIQRLQDAIMAIPGILLILSIFTVLGVGLFTAVVAMSIMFTPMFSRLSRGAAISIKNMEYVLAAQALGASHIRIMFRHILPGIAAPLITYATLAMGYSVLAVSGLSFLGLGAQPPSPEWGAMLNVGTNFLREAWWMSVFPGLAISAVVFFINLLGDGLVIALDPKLRQ